jgi:NAD(P)-dependent dehydrogenase (short-subunit alcohol dehydrogenase family)
MSETRIALITGANQGVGFQVAKELVANGVTVYLGSRNLERGEAAASEIGPGAIALQVSCECCASTASPSPVRSSTGPTSCLSRTGSTRN